MKKSLLVIFLTLLALSAAALSAPRRAAARPAASTPPPAGVRLLPDASSLAFTQRLLVAETAPDSRQSLLYLMDPANLSQKTAFAQVTHRAGYPPAGQVSPDGKWVSILAVPPGAGETAARTDGGEVWLLAADGSDAQRLTASASRLAGWSADGGWLAFVRLSPLSNPPQPQIPFRTEVYRARPDGQDTSLIFADAENYGVWPLGWLPDGSYLTALLDLRGVWRLAAYANGAQVRAWELPIFDHLRGITLSPSGDQVLLDGVHGVEETLIAFDLSSGQSLPQLAAAPIPPGQPVTPLQAVWSAQGHVWILRQTQAGGLAQSAVTGPNPPPDAPRLDLPAGEYLLPQSWSPDENWFLYRRYPRIYSDMYLQPRDRDALTALHPEQPGNWLTLIGWIPAGGQQ